MKTLTLSIRQIYFDQIDENNKKIFYDEAVLEFPAMVIDYQRAVLQQDANI